jgi:alkyl sulfatase BDS1-like metallo-beta-lactamase superfamily hydrolase
LLNHVVFADPDDTAARELLAATYERLAYGAENATWRNFYLMGALELRSGVMRPAATPRSLDLLLALSAEELFDSIAIRVDGPRAWDEHLTIDWRFTDLGRVYRTTLRNGVLVQEADPDPGDTDLTLVLTKVELLALLGGSGFEGIEMAGDVGVLERLLALVDRGGAHFPIVTP